MSVPLQARGPSPLREGTVLDERFAIGEVLGRGSFGITYLAEDLARGDRAVVNELAPSASQRVGDDLRFLNLGPAAAQRLRHQFTSEARKLQKVRIPRVPQYRAVFHENQTAYVVTDFIVGARPMTSLLDGGPHTYDSVRWMFDLLLETLENVHNHGLLHQDVRPSNILLGAGGEPYLVDFGSARQWCADLTIAHEEQFEAEYAPIEQLSERGRRSPSSDLYGLAAITYTLLAQSPPPPVAERLDGAEVPMLSQVRRDVPDAFANAIHAMLEVEPEDRPQTAIEVRDLILRPVGEPEVEARIFELDAKRKRLKRFRHDPKQCPACGDVLTVPVPLAPDTCPVCQDGKIRKRRIEEKLCPTCGGGILRALANSTPLRFCPACSLGMMSPNRRLLRETVSWTCEACSFTLLRAVNGARDRGGREQSWDDWRRESGRQESVMFCEACLAQYDVLQDGKWQRTTPDAARPQWTRLYPDEWARVAIGLAPDAGNAACESCGADFFIADGCITLLSDPPLDPFGFASHYCGRLVPLPELPFLAVGKESGHKGLVCKSCHIEFDTLGGDLKLVRSSDQRLRRHAGEAHSLRDWHRIAQDLPKAGDEDEIEEDIARALVEAYVKGEIGLDAKDSDLIWRGQAMELRDGETSSRPMRFTVTTESITFGGLWRKRSELLRDVARVTHEGGKVQLVLIDGGTWTFRIEPIKLTVRLESGRDQVDLGAEQLAKRLSAVTKRDGRQA